MENKKLGSEKLGKKKKVIDNRLTGGTEYQTDIYGIVDDLFHDDESEIVVSTKNKYFAHAVMKFLEDMNFTFTDSDIEEPRLVILLEDGSFKFIDHMEEHVSFDLPYEWDALESRVREYVSTNPIVKKEVTRDDTNWNTPTNEQGLVNSTINDVKDWVKEIQKKVSISSEKAAELARKHIRRTLHGDNQTIYTATGNPDLQLKSGMYNNIEDLLNKNGWSLQFETDYGMNIREYLRSRSDDKDVELNLLSNIGFDYIRDDIIVTEHKYWTNRIIEVQYKDQDQDNIDSINIDESEFRNESENESENELNSNQDIVVEQEKVVEYKDLVRYDKETPIFIVGTMVDHQRELNITDNHIWVDIVTDDDKMEFWTDGQVAILTMDEFKKHKTDLLSRSDISVIAIPKMIGNMGIRALNVSGDTTTDFDVHDSDNIFEQVPTYSNIELKIPNGVSCMEVNESTVDIILRMM